MRNVSAAVSPRTGALVLSRNRFALVVALSLIGPSLHDAVATPACATMTASDWHDTTGTYVLTQSSNGFITGTLQAEAAGQCPGAWYSIGGSYTGNGNFTFTATWFNPSDPVGGPYSPRPPGCAQTISYSGTLTQPGCNNATGPWSNSGGLSGTFAMHHSCDIPSETTPQFQYWGGSGNYPTSAIFRQSLTATNFNWGGRTLTETFPPGGTTDTCWWPGSQYTVATPTPKSINLSGGTPTNYLDAIGMSPEVVTYYRQNGRSPCEFTHQQAMLIDCPVSEGGNIEYKTNALLLRANQTTVRSGRAGVEVEQAWGTPAPSIIVSSIIVPILLL